MPGYDEKHAKAGLKTPLPPIETFPSQYPKYTVTIETPEYNAICPKTGLPDFGILTVIYEPAQRVIELKSFKEYLTAYRHVGIFYENAVNRILADIVRAAKPRWCRVVLKTGPRGGMRSVVEAMHGRAPDLSIEPSGQMQALEGGVALISMRGLSARGSKRKGMRAPRG